MDSMNRLTQRLNAAGFDTALVTDPNAIRYFTGTKFSPGERLLALVLRADGNHRFFINELFQQTKDLGAPITYYNDTQDGVALIANAMLPGETAAIDKNWPARFLLRFQELHTGKCVNSSPIVDGVRARKTEEEQEKMRVASKLNDRVMGKIIPILSENHTER